mmetsp:Transcript_78108/g.162216  ORF Transcript_78108/g.162216 Transcript_78108/m.162216 type:complete len:281 (-) Transcript_78108:48-890(-)
MPACVHRERSSRCRLPNSALWSPSVSSRECRASWSSCSPSSPERTWARARATSTRLKLALFERVLRAVREALVPSRSLKIVWGTLRLITGKLISLDSPKRSVKSRGNLASPKSTSRPLLSQHQTFKESSGRAVSPISQKLCPGPSVRRPNSWPPRLTSHPTSPSTAGLRQVSHSWSKLLSPSPPGLPSTDTRSFLSNRTCAGPVLLSTLASKYSLITCDLPPDALQMRQRLEVGGAPRLMILDTSTAKTIGSRLVKLAELKSMLPFLMLIEDRLVGMPPE